MKAIIYARYSSDNQREESIEGQIRECSAFAEKNGITILKHYIDRAFSAKTDNRPEFQQMIKDSNQGLFDVVLVWKLDRFARNRYDSAHYKHLLRKNGVKVISATEAISEGAEGIILESVLEGYAEYYSVDLSEKIKRGQTENALKCVSNGAPSPLGYKVNDERHFEIDPLTAPFILETFQMYNKGKTIKEIVEYLNEKGLRNSIGNKMQATAVSKILRNRRYIGEFIYGDITIPNGIPQIVPEDLFESVQKKLDKNKRAPARKRAEEDYLLSTKLYCGHCGVYMNGESGTSHTSKIHRYYKCSNAKKKKTCTKKTVKKDWIEDLIIEETVKLIMDDKVIDAIINSVLDHQESENNNIPYYEKQLSEVEKAIDNMLNAIQQGILTSSTKERLEELESRKKELEDRITLEELSKPKISEDFITFYLHQFRKLDIDKIEHRKALIDTFVNAIYLYDDKVIIAFNYKDGSKTVELNEVNTAVMNYQKEFDYGMLSSTNSYIS